MVTYLIMTISLHIVTVANFIRDYKYTFSHSLLLDHDYSLNI